MFEEKEYESLSSTGLFFPVMESGPFRITIYKADDIDVFMVFGDSINVFIRFSPFLVMDK